MIRPGGHLFVLTGAGVSAESGLGVFRDPEGIWSKYDLEEVATPEGFARNPTLVHEFYNLRRASLLRAAPNQAHAALARLEEAWRARGGSMVLVTQNVDDLHERAGSHNVIHMHGELLKTRCALCGDVRVWAGGVKHGPRLPGLRPRGRNAPPCGLVRRDAVCA